MGKNRGGNFKPKKADAPKGRQTASKALPAHDTISLFIEKYSFAIAGGLIFLVAFIVYKDFLLFKNVFLYKDIGSDTVNISYPPMKHIADYIHSVGLPKWSFNYGMGQNIFPFFLQRDPFDVLLFMAGKESLAYGIGYIEFLKVIMGGLVFFFYLRT